MSHFKKIFKFFALTILTIILVALLFFVFILQGALSIHAPFYLVPLYLLPITLSSFLFSLLLLRLLKRKQILRLSATFSALMLTLAISFQLLKVDPYFGKVELVGPFSKSVPYILVESNFKRRLAVSVLEGISFFAITKFDKEFMDYTKLAVKETVFAYSLKSIFDKDHLAKNCQRYAQAKIPYQGCAMDFHSSVVENNHFTSSGNILLVAVTTVGIFTIKDINSKRIPEASSEINAQSFMDVMEMSAITIENLLITQRLKINEDTPFFVIIEKVINQKFGEISLKNISPPPTKLVSQIKARNNSVEIKRLNRLTDKLRKISIEISTSPKYSEEYYKTLIEKYKSKSLLFRIAEIFDSEINDKLISLFLKV